MLSEAKHPHPPVGQLSQIGIVVRDLGTIYEVVAVPKIRILPEMEYPT